MKVFRRIIFTFILAVSLCLGMVCFSPVKESAQAEQMPDDILTFMVHSTNAENIFIDGATDSFQTFDDAYNYILNQLGEVDKFALNFGSGITTDSALNLSTPETISEIWISGNISGNLPLGENLVEINQESSCKYFVNNATFNGLSETGTAIFNNSKNVTISFGGSIAVNNGFLTNAGVGSITTHDTVSSANKLKIAVPARNNVIIAKNLSDGELLNNQTSNFEFVPAGDFFTVETALVNGSIVSNATVNVSFETNGGAFADEFSPKQIIDAFGIEFPTASQISKPHCTFVGWFAKLENDEKTLYFDSEMLQHFTDAGSDLDLVENIFTQNTDNFESVNAFENANNINECINLFTSINKTPTFVAVFSDNLYTVSFETNGGEPVSSITDKFDSKLTLPEPIRTGYTFEGWFEDEGLETPFLGETMPDEDITLYAGWVANQITITFFDNGIEVGTFTGNYGDEIKFPVLDSKTGAEFVGWFEDETLETNFTQTTLSATNQTVYAKWQNIKYSIIINSMGANPYQNLSLEYGADLSKIVLNSPSKTGFKFCGWFTSIDFNETTAFKFEGTMPASNFVIYAKWEANVYKISFVTNTNSSISSKEYLYKMDITLPTIIVPSGKVFGGWFTDSDLTSPFTLQTMPAEDITLYAKWTDKLFVTINKDPQTYLAENPNFSFNNFSDLNGFLVEYKVDGAWVSDVPQEIGIYDVRISRGEDELYNAFETVIAGGLILTGTEINLNWLIITLFIFSALELIAIVSIRHLKNMKRNMTLASVVPVFAYLLPVSQLVLLIISGVLALFMFILLIYEIVGLHRTVPLKLEAEQNERTQLANLSQEQIAEAEEEIQSIGSKYSAQDITSLLARDNYRKEHTRVVKTPVIEKDDTPYESAIDKARKHGFNHSFEKDELVDDVEIQDKNGMKIQTVRYSNEHYETEFDNWRNRIQSDVPDGEN